MKTILKTIVLLLLIAVVGIITYFAVTGRKLDSHTIRNLPETIDLSAECPSVSNLVVAAEVNLTIRNSGSKSHQNVIVRINGYDNDHNLVKSKTTTFERVLSPNSSLTKPVTLPAKVKTCECEIVSSN